MNICFENPNLLDIIVTYLDLKDIFCLSMSNKILKEMLDPKNNSKVNVLYFLKIINEFFDYDKSYLKKRKILLGKNLKFEVNWKQYFNHLLTNFGKCEDQNINKKIRDFFRIHIYLPDIRKEIFFLENQNSTIHITRCYDTKINLIHTYNFYSKYITPEFILNKNETHGKIVILREKLIFEEYLINFKILFYDFIINEKYKNFIINVCKYDIEALIEIYHCNDQEKTNFKVNEQNNNIIKFIVWVSNLFILYANINCQYIKGLIENDNTDEHELITEFITKKSELENCGLLINSHFENVNIIVNLLNIYKKIYDSYSDKYLKSHQSFDFFTPEFRLNKSDSDQYKSKIIYSKKFTLYNLFLDIIDKYYTKNLPQIKNKYPVIARDYFIEALNPKEENDNKPNEIKMDIEEINQNGIQDEIKNEILIEGKKPENKKSPKKILLENYFNCVLDGYVDEKNANGIMHTKFKVDKSFVDDYEEVLINIFEDEINNCFKENMPTEKIFDNIEKITRCEGNSKNLYPNKESLNVIRRTKIKLMEKGYIIVFNHLQKEMLKDFADHIRIDEKDNEKYIYLSTMEKLNMKEYNINMEVLSKEGVEHVKQNVKDESERAINYLKTNLNLRDSEYYLAKDYIECSKIDYVYFFKKLLWNYYLQLEIYKERDYKIKYYILNNKKKFIEKNKDYGNAVNDCSEGEPNDNNKNEILIH